ncbi:hypothetical protein GCM10023221_30990 [Luteimicrobium xylanilyticum]
MRLVSRVRSARPPPPAGRRRRRSRGARHGTTHGTNRGSGTGARGRAGARRLQLGGSGGSGGGDTGAAPSAAPASGGAVEVDAHQGALGTYLTDGKGNTLYLFVADPAGKSTCSGSCAAAWPPVVASGKPTAGDGVDAAKLTTIKRDDGSEQVAYDGHALYYFVKDTSAGATTGQGVDGFGAPWWVVAPSGSAITTAAGTGGASTSPSDDSGYSY